MVLKELTGGISTGQLRQLTTKMSDILEVVPEGKRVAIEGTPIYLGRPWSDDHSLGYHYLLSTGRDVLIRKFCNIEHAVLIDDYSVNTSDGALEYLSMIGLPIDRVEWESRLIHGAEALMARLSSKVLRRNDGRQISLITPSGRYACALLDAVFQGSKEVDFNVIIHPIGFTHEQEEMRMILQEAEGGLLPFTLINVFFKNGSISKVYTTEPNGRTTRVGL